MDIISIKNKVAHTPCKLTLYLNNSPNNILYIIESFSKLNSDVTTFIKNLTFVSKLNDNTYAATGQNEIIYVFKYQQTLTIAPTLNTVFCYINSHTNDKLIHYYNNHINEAYTNYFVDTLLNKTTLEKLLIGKGIGFDNNVCCMIPNMQLFYINKTNRNILRLNKDKIAIEQLLQSVIFNVYPKPLNEFVFELYDLYQRKKYDNIKKIMLDDNINSDTHIPKHIREYVYNKIKSMLLTEKYANIFKLDKTDAEYFKTIRRYIINYYSKYDINPSNLQINVDHRMSNNMWINIVVRYRNTYSDSYLFERLTRFHRTLRLNDLIYYLSNNFDLADNLDNLIEQSFSYDMIDKYGFDVNTDCVNKIQLKYRKINHNYNYANYDIKIIGSDNLINIPRPLISNGKLTNFKIHRILHLFTFKTPIIVGKMKKGCKNLVISTSFNANEVASLFFLYNILSVVLRL